MATDTLENESTTQEPEPNRASAKKATSSKPAPKKNPKKKATKKRAAKTPVTAKKRLTRKSIVKKPEAKKAAKKATKKQTDKTEPAPKISKAQAIRDAAGELGKKARPKQIIAALAEKGITVTSPQVSMTLKAAGLRRGRRKKKVTAAIAVQHPARNGKAQTLNIDHLVLVRELATKIGGIDRLKESVAALEKLQSIWLRV